MHHLQLESGREKGERSGLSTRGIRSLLQSCHCLSLLSVIQDLMSSIYGEIFLSAAHNVSVLVIGILSQTQIFPFVFCAWGKKEKKC